MSKVIITLGYPASGKTTFLDTLDLKDNYLIFDADKYDQKLSYHARNKMMCSDILQSVQSGKQNIILNASSGGSKFKQTLEYFHKAGYEIIVLIFPTNIDEAKMRNASRDRVVPEEGFQICDELLPTNIMLANQYASKVYSILTERIKE